MFSVKTIRARLGLILFLLSIALLGTGGGLYYIQDSLGDAVQVSGKTGSGISTVINTARQAQVDFQRQVQEWKNILIRGNDAELYEKHKNAFAERAADVKRLLQQAREQVAALDQPLGEIDALLVAHSTMLAKYNEALTSFDAKDAETGKRVDTLVRGVDRETSTGLDRLNDGLVQYATKRLAELETNATQLSNRAQWASIAALLIALVVVVVGIQVIRVILRNIRALTSTVERVAAGDYDARARMETQDEIGVLANTFDKLLDDRVSGPSERVERERTAQQLSHRDHAVCCSAGATRPHDQGAGNSRCHWRDFRRDQYDDD